MQNTPFSKNNIFQNNFSSNFSYFGKSKIIANYLELSTLEYVQTRSKNNFESYSTIMPLFYIMSCWKLLWCLSLNELIGEVLRHKIEENKSFLIYGEDKNTNRKNLSIPEMTEGEVSRYALAYSPLFRIVIGVLRWLRWESRVNPNKQNDILIRDNYFLDYPESRISWKNLKNDKRFYHLDWSLIVNKSSISFKDDENTQELFKLAFYLLRKGCRMQLDIFLQEKAKAHWLICLMDGMDAYLNCDEKNDHYVDLSNFLEILPKIDDLWMNENEEEKEDNFLYSTSMINKDLALNDTLFKESFEFLDLMEKSFIFPASDNLKESSSINNVGNINRLLLYKFMKKTLESNNEKMGKWEKAFYSILCGDFNQLYSISNDDFDKLFALFQTEKINIFNNWSDFLESNTQINRNNVFLGKIQPIDRLGNALYKRVSLLTRDIYPEVTSKYILQDCENTSEFNLLNNFQSNYKFDFNTPNKNLIDMDESSPIYYSDTRIIDINEIEKQLTDSLIDSIFYLEVDRRKDSIDNYFFHIYKSIIHSSLNTKDYNNEFISIIDEFLNFISNKDDILYLGSIRAFIAQIAIAHIEIMNSSNIDNFNSYIIDLFDESTLDFVNMDQVRSYKVTSIDIKAPIIQYPFLIISDQLADKFISQYLSYIIENNNRVLDVFFLMLEYASFDCKVNYINKILCKNQCDLNIQHFQEIVYNLITQFPSETINVALTFVDEFNNNNQNLILKTENNSTKIVDELISKVEFLILLFGTIFQFLIVRQDYSPSSEIIIKVLDSIIQYNENSSFENQKDFIMSSIKKLKDNLLSENPSNQTVSEAIIGIFILNEVNPFSLLFQTLEIIKSSNLDEIDYIENNSSISSFARSNSCIDEFIIPIILEPTIIRLFTIIVSNSQVIQPIYTNYKINQLISDDFLQTKNWEENIIFLFSIGNSVNINDINIPFLPIKFILSQITYYKVLNLIKTYQNSVDELRNCLQLFEYNIFQYENNSKNTLKNHLNFVGSPKSHLSSPNSKNTNSMPSSHKRNSLNTLNLESQIQNINQKISESIKNLELMLNNWLVSLPEIDSKEDFNKEESEELISRFIVLPEYCSFDDGCNIKSSVKSENEQLLFKSKFVNIQRLFDQLVSTIIFHHETEIYSNNLNSQNIRKSLNSTKNNQSEFKSIMFFFQLLHLLEKSTWIFNKF